METPFGTNFFSSKKLLFLVPLRGTHWPFSYHCVTEEFFTFKIALVDMTAKC